MTTHENSDLIERLCNEADLCRNDGADDIAKLLDEAVSALTAQAPAVGEPLKWEATTSAYTKFITDSKYKALRPEYRKWYRPICDACSQAAQQAAQAPVGWLPIETAPKDGTPIMVIHMAASEPAPDIAHWSEEDQLFRVGYADDWASSASRGLRSWYDVLSHWTPLPPLPASRPQPEVKP